jgi:hypothetical protein
MLSVVPADLPDRAVATLAQLNDLGLEPSGERPARARPLALIAFHDLYDGHPLRGNAPDRGCPSKRVRPKYLVSSGLTRTHGFGRNWAQMQVAWLVAGSVLSATAAAAAWRWTLTRSELVSEINVAQPPLS